LACRRFNKKLFRRGESLKRKENDNVAGLRQEIDAPAVKDGNRTEQDLLAELGDKIGLSFSPDAS
jgi:hypothetical protein